MYASPYVNLALCTCPYITLYIRTVHTVHVTRNLRNPRIHCISNPQFFCGIVEDIRGFVKGCPRNCQRVSAESLKGVRGIVKGCPRNCQRVSTESSKGVRGIVKGCPWNRQRVSAESSKGVCGFVEGHQHSHNRQRHLRNRTVVLE